MVWSPGYFRVHVAEICGGLDLKAIRSYLPSSKMYHLWRTIPRQFGRKGSQYNRFSTQEHFSVVVLEGFWSLFFFFKGPFNSHAHTFPPPGSDIKTLYFPQSYLFLDI